MTTNGEATCTTGSSWMVQATVNEPFLLLVAFVAHYLELGADLVHLHLDSPHPEAGVLFADHPKIRLTLCDGAYWAKASHKGRPNSQTARQVINATQTFEGLVQDWLFLCDADEFLVPDRDLRSLLSEQSAELDFLRVRVAEKILPPNATPVSIFEGRFRLPFQRRKQLGIRVYGPQLATMLERGVAGHNLGKSIVRRGAQVSIGVHRPFARQSVAKDRPPPKKPAGAWLPDAFLAHFDALTPLHYLTKLLGRNYTAGVVARTTKTTRDSARLAQIAFAHAACAEEHPIVLVAELHRLTPNSEAALEKRGLLLDLALAPERIVRKHFPNLNLDFSPSGFDHALRVKFAERLAANGVA